MSQTLVRSASAGALFTPKTSVSLQSEPTSALAIKSENRYRDFENSTRSWSYTDLVSDLRDHFIVEDFSSAECWLKNHPELYGPLCVASQQIDFIFGPGRLKRLTVIEDWEGTFAVSLEVEFGGSGQNASKLCRRFVSEWLVHQESNVRQALDLGVRFV